MNWLKLSGALLVLLCVTAFGFYLSYRSRQRLAFLKAVLSMLSNLESNIRYYRGDILTLLRMSAPDGLARGANSRGQFAEEFIARYSPKRSHAEKLRELIAGLGALDAEGEIERLRLYETMFEELYNNSLEEYKTKSKLYRSLGFFAGAALAVVLV